MANRWGNSDKLLFGGSKITANGDYSHEVKRHLLLGRKAMVNLDRVLKSRHHLTDKGLYSQSYVFFQWSCTDIWVLDQREGWVPNNWCFWIVVLKKTLQSPLDSKRSNQSILKEINLEYSLEGLLLKLKLQYFGYLNWSADSLEKTLMLGKIEGKRRRGMTEDEMHHQLNGYEFEQTAR